MAETASSFDMTPVVDTTKVTARRKADIVHYLTQESDNGQNDARLIELLSALKLHRSVFIQWLGRLAALEHAASIEAAAPTESGKSSGASSANGSAASGRNHGDAATGPSPEAPARRAVIIDDDFEQKTLAELGDHQGTLEGIPRSVFMEMRQRASYQEFGLILVEGKAKDVLRDDQPQKLAVLCAIWREFGYGKDKVANHFGLSDHLVERTVEENPIPLSAEEQLALEVIDRLLSEPRREFSGLHLRAAVAGIRLARKARNGTLKSFKARHGLANINGKPFAAYTTRQLAPWAFGEMSIAI
ncbi:hypothetical protein HZA87_00755 [Candidatus Uhrbacteria bacterium]|nr:hypothetical protein [Candidatus Uhrbacteria bacterium]